MKKRLFSLSIALVLVVCLIGARSSFGGDSCTGCHGDKAKMESLGYSQFHVTAEEVATQSKMKAAQCSNCHLGNPSASEKEDAHKGLLRLMVVKRDWVVMTRDRMPPEDLIAWPSLEPRGKSRATALAPKMVFQGVLKDNPAYLSVVYHDKNPETLAFNPAIAERTCGTCHADIVKNYLKTPMGGGKGAHTQSQYLTWTDSPSPQSCGLWIGALSAPDHERFTDANIKTFNRHSTAPISEKAAFNVQRNCNQCHVGCLDCHYSPLKRDVSNASMGAHTFAKIPQPLSCYGGGRSFSCHAGPLERRRGDGFMRAEFSQAAADGKAVLNKHQDVHLQEGIVCVDCHEPNKSTGQHGDLKRTVECEKCHGAVVARHRRGMHRRVDCASCHTARIGGYAFNFWTATGQGENFNPISRLQGYLVDAVLPLIINNPKGTWIPVHVVPHTSSNIKANDATISKRLLFRGRPDSRVERRYPSDDAFAVTGIVRNLDDNDGDVMVWLNVDRIAHSLGKARTCESCHASRSQSIRTRYELLSEPYKDIEDGEYTIIADSKGLRITDFKGAGDEPPPSGLKPFIGKWDLAGDFRLPPLKDEKLYKTMKRSVESGQFMH